MTLPAPHDIAAAITAGTVLSADKFSVLDHDAILDARDGKDFSDRWMQSFNAVTEAWADFRSDDDLSALVEEIRREAFMAASRASGQHEIASYVSDDFEIITRAAALKMHNSFIVALWSAYAQQTVPDLENTSVQ